MIVARQSLCSFFTSFKKQIESFDTYRRWKIDDRPTALGRNSSLSAPILCETLRVKRREKLTVRWGRNVKLSKWTERYKRIDNRQEIFSDETLSLCRRTCLVGTYFSFVFFFHSQPKSLLSRHGIERKKSFFVEVNSTFFLWSLKIIRTGSLTAACDWVFEVGVRWRRKSVRRREVKSTEESIAVVQVD